MISFLFFVKIAQNGELRSGDLFPHVFLFPERSEKPLVYRAAAGAPFLSLIHIWSHPSISIPPLWRGGMEMEGWDLRALAVLERLNAAGHRAVLVLSLIHISCSAGR